MSCCGSDPPDVERRRDRAGPLLTHDVGHLAVDVEGSRAVGRRAQLDEMRRRNASTPDAGIRTFAGQGPDGSVGDLDRSDHAEATVLPGGPSIGGHPQRPVRRPGIADGRAGETEPLHPCRRSWEDRPGAPAIRRTEELILAEDPPTAGRDEADVRGVEDLADGARPGTARSRLSPTPRAWSRAGWRGWRHCVLRGAEVQAVRSRTTSRARRI